MKRILYALLLALAAVPSFAALQYEYVQKSINEDSVVASSDLTARATLDGARARVDFIDGNLYPPGTYVISTDGARLFFVDPTKKWYTEFNAAGAVSAIGATNIKLENIRTDVQKMNDRPMVAGIETEHYQLTMSYDVIVTMRAVPLKQSVQTVIDTWVTNRFGNVTQHAALGGGFRTGNAQVDQLLDHETTKVPGFALRQTVTIRTTAHTRAVRSQLQVNPTRTMSREMRVLSINEVVPAPSLFTIPANFTRANTGEMPKVATDTLSFQPVSPK
jgi:hypothetical protein